MIKYCLEQWDKNRDRLYEYMDTHQEEMNGIGYSELVKIIVREILNNDCPLYNDYSTDNITEIDNGDYQGTLLFMIPRNTYQPDPHSYILTFVDYGSCCGCDTLERIQSDGDYHSLNVTQLSDFMTLCKDIVSNMIVPYNDGWRHSDMYDTVTF